MSSYHDVYITTEKTGRIALSDFAFRVELSCTRIGGWQLWARYETSMIGPELTAELLGGEYDTEKWLIIDINGHVILDSKNRIEVNG